MKKERTSGITLCDLLGVAFIVLKLCKVIDWSWWWVLAPFWIPVIILIILMIIYTSCGGDFDELL